MPQIPTVVAPQLTPPPEMNPNIAGRPGQAIASAAEQLGELSEYGVRETALLKKTQDEGIMLAAQNHIDADIQRAEVEAEVWTDFTHADQLKQNTADALHQKYVDQYGNRPDLWRGIEPYLGRQLNHYNGLVDRRATTLTTDFNQAALYDKGNLTVDKAASEPSIMGKEMIWAEYDSLNDAMQRNGSIHALQGETEKKRIRSQTIATEVERAANPSNSPEIMEEEMGRLKEYQAKGYVDSEHLERLNNTLTAAYDRATTRSDKMDVARQVNTMLTAAQKDPTLKDQSTGQINYLEAAKRVGEDPELPLNVKKEAQQTFEQQDAIQKRMRAEYHTRSLDELEPRIGVQKNPLTRNEVHNRALLTPSDPKWIMPETEAALLRTMNQTDRENRAENTQQRMELRQETEYESAGIMRGLLATPGYIADESELYQGENAKMTKGDRATVWGTKNIKRSNEYEDARKMMAASTFYPNTDEGSKAFADDMAKLRQTVDEKHLVGSQIVDEAARMIQPKVDAEKHQTIKTLLDNIWPVAKQIITGQPQTYKLPTSGEKVKPGERTAIGANGETLVVRGGKWVPAQP